MFSVNKQKYKRNLGLIIPFKGVPPQKPRDLHGNNLQMAHRTFSECHTADQSFNTKTPERHCAQTIQKTRWTALQRV